MQQMPLIFYGEVDSFYFTSFLVRQRQVDWQIYLAADIIIGKCLHNFEVCGSLLRKIGFQPGFAFVFDIFCALVRSINGRFAFYSGHHTKQIDKAVFSLFAEVGHYLCL